MKCDCERIRKLKFYTYLIYRIDQNYNLFFQIFECKKMTNQVDADNWLETVRGGTVLPERELRILCEKVKEILIEESNV